ncbi:MAG: hypothetical protein Q9194_007559, partial [Teloschistes cf. exilis]
KQRPNCMYDIDWRTEYHRNGDITQAGPHKGGWVNTNSLHGGALTMDKRALRMS